MPQTCTSPIRSMHLLPEFFSRSFCFFFREHLIQVFVPASQTIPRTSTCECPSSAQLWFRRPLSGTHQNGYVSKCFKEGLRHRIVLPSRLQISPISDSGFRVFRFEVSLFRMFRMFRVWGSGFEFRAGLGWLPQVLRGWGSCWGPSSPLWKRLG